MSGINAYCQLNFNAMRLGLPSDRQDLPPADECPASLDTMEVVVGTVAAGDIIANWTHNGIADVGHYNEVQLAGPFLSPGRKEVYSRFRYVSAAAGNVLTKTIEDLDIGMYYWVRVRYVDDRGQVSAWMYGQATPFVGI